MTEALRLRKMSAAQMAAHNILYQEDLRIAFMWLGQDWACRLRHVRTVKERGVRLVAECTPLHTNLSCLISANSGGEIHHPLQTGQDGLDAGFMSPSRPKKPPKLAMRRSTLFNDGGCFGIGLRATI